MRSSTETLIAAMRILARDIRSTDGIANAAIREAADRLEEMAGINRELLEACQAAMRIVALWRPPVDVSPEHHHEADALLAMEETFTMAIAKATERK